MLESVYSECLAWEIGQSGLKVAREVAVPLRYKALEFEQGYRLDLLVEDRVVVEVKAVERLQPIHEAQLLSYLKIMDCRLGLLLNFNVDVMRNGVRRIANGL